MSTTAIEEIELSERYVSFEPEDTHSVLDGQLPPPDRGFGAWSFLLTASLVEAVVWGFPETFGGMYTSGCVVAGNTHRLHSLPCVLHQ
jgi:MFS transporter, MCT family, solute carrier family 16 (monocarboxylic acid transporters), member 10